jgi:hypothetical protein
MSLLGWHWNSPVIRLPTLVKQCYDPSTQFPRRQDHLVRTACSWASFRGEVPCKSTPRSRFRHDFHTSPVTTEAALPLSGLLADGLWGRVVQHEERVAAPEAGEGGTLSIRECIVTWLSRANMKAYGYSYQ